MMNTTKKILPFLFFGILLIGSNSLFGRTKEQTGKGDELQRAPYDFYDIQKNTVSNIEFYSTNYGIFGLNTIQNRGGGIWPRGSQNQYIFGGGIWFGAVKQRPDLNQTKKYVEVTYNPNNGNSWMVPGRSKPNANRNQNKDLDKADQTDIKKYRLYFSTDFRTSDGQPLNANDGPAWPIWDTSPLDTLKSNRYFGYYEDNIGLRTKTQYPKGPAFITGEDIFSTFKDTELDRYDGGKSLRESEGYPLRLQFEQTIYSWGFGDYRDIIFLKYNIMNFSTDTLKECWMAPVMDIDIARVALSQQGAQNDWVKYCDYDTTLNLAYQWTEGTQGEAGYGFGYLGFNFLESPAVYRFDRINVDLHKSPRDSIRFLSNFNFTEIRDTTIINNKDTVRINGVDTVVKESGEIEYYSCSEAHRGANPNNILDTIFFSDKYLLVKKVKYDKQYIKKNGYLFYENKIVDYDISQYLRKDKRFFLPYEQIGLKTFRNWPIAVDKNLDDERYDFMSAGIKDRIGTTPGDFRFMMATGPFYMLPGDTARIVVGMILANPSARSEADGNDTNDIKELIRKVKFAQAVYDNNFRAPIPPDRSVINQWVPLNNSIKISWDATAEYTNDTYEKGMDFLGYRIYRARRTNLDTFSVDNVSPTNDYPSGKGPFGWKQIAEFSIPPVISKSYKRTGPENNTTFPFIDSLRIIGPAYNIYKDTLGRDSIDIDFYSIRVLRVAKGLTLPMNGAEYLVGRKFYSDTLAMFIPSVLRIDTSKINYFSDVPPRYPWNDFFIDLYNKCKAEQEFARSKNPNQKVEAFPIFLNPYDIDYLDTNKKQNFVNRYLVGTVKLNPAYLKYNPLFYTKVTVNIRPQDTSLYGAISPDVVNKKRPRDTINIKNFKEIYVNNVRYLTWDRLVPIREGDCMRDYNHLRETLDSIYAYYKKQWIKETVFPDLEAINDSIPFDWNDLSKGYRKYRFASVIDNYMSSITNNRTFVDIGDDNHSNNITYNDDPTRSEKLLNNIDYYYKILAYDEGDFTQPTPRKLNDAFPGLPNLQECYPKAGAPKNNVEFKTVSANADSIGGIYNFKLFSIDNERVNELFGGRRFKVEFQPIFRLFERVLINLEPERRYDFALYTLRIKITDLKTGNLLYHGNTWLEENSGQPRYSQQYTENAISWFWSDTAFHDPGREVTFMMQNDYGRIQRTGFITSGDFSVPSFYSQLWQDPYNYQIVTPWSQDALGNLGFSFNYSIQQFGGRYRPDSLSMNTRRSSDGLFFGLNPAPNSLNAKYSQGPPINIIDTDIPNGDITRVFTTQIVDTVTAYTYIATIPTDTAKPMRNGPPLEMSFNNGPATYRLTFQNGGTHRMDLEYGKRNQKKIRTFNVPYLVFSVENLAEYKRPGDNGGDSVIVHYPPVPPFVLPDSGVVNYPDLRNLKSNAQSFIGHYNMSSWGFVNSRVTRGVNLKKDQIANIPGTTIVTNQYKNIGVQNRYYLTGLSDPYYDTVAKVTKIDTIDFCNIFNGSGAQFALDFVNYGGSRSNMNEWTPVENDFVDTARGILEPVNYTFSNDFKPGDQVILRTWGGALGLPLPGATIICESSDPTPKEMTDELMDKIKVVPNPYYISHQGQKSPYDSKIYFTKLPEDCTIDIYTVNGDLVKSISHNEPSYTDPEDKSLHKAVEVWDLMSRNKQRVASQTLVAVIKAGNGAQTVKKFTIVVGGFRLIPD